MHVSIFALPLTTSKVGDTPTFSTDSPWLRMKSSSFSPLLFESGPNRVLWALVSIPMMSG